MASEAEEGKLKIRLYMDEDSMREVLVEALRARGVDVITALDAETIGWSDQEQLDYATEQGRCCARSISLTSTGFILSI